VQRNADHGTEFSCPSRVIFDPRSRSDMSLFVRFAPKATTRRRHRAGVHWRVFRARGNYLSCKPGFSCGLESPIGHVGPLRCAIPSMRRVGWNCGHADPGPFEASTGTRRTVPNASGPYSIIVAYEIALDRLKVADRNAPMALLVAKSTLQMAREGERDPKRLSDGVIRLYRVNPKPPKPRCG